MYAKMGGRDVSDSPPFWNNYLSKVTGDFSVNFIASSKHQGEILKIKQLRDWFEGLYNRLHEYLQLPSCLDELNFYLLQFYEIELLSPFFYLLNRGWKSTFLLIVQ